MRNWLIAAVALAVAGLSFAAGEDATCMVNYGTSTSGITSRSVDGGSCTFAKGGTVLMQCSTAIHFSQTPLQDVVVAAYPDAGAGVDAGTYTTLTTAYLDAGLQDFKVDFTSNSDPYLVYLCPNCSNISVRGSSAAGYCVFGPSTVRSRP